MATIPPEPQRPDTRRQGRHLTLAAIATLAILVSLVVTSWPTARPTPTPTPSQIAAGSPTPTAPGPTSSAIAEPWEDLALEPFVPLASLTPTVADEAGVAPDVGFVFESLTGEPAAAMAGRLQVVPPTELQVTPGDDTRHATVTPSAALQPSALYRFVLRSADGTLAGSWAFRVRGPVRVLGTLPGDRSTSVPLRTGIEVTFDQEDVADIEGSFTIEPAVEGRFERYGRTQVFVPSELRPSTTYTVSIKAGLPRTGTDLRLEKDVIFRFETEGRTASGVRWIAGRDVVEASPSEPPVIGILGDSRGPGDEEGGAIPSTAEVSVYRYASEAQAADALRSFLESPRWMEFSGPVLPVAGLAGEVEFTAQLEELPDPWSEESNHRVVRFPTRLDPGFYAVEIEGVVPAYVFLQVTRVSAWASILMDRTVLWVNDVVTGRPIAGASAALPGGAGFGTSGDDGILNAPTPQALLPAAVAEPEDGTSPPPPIVAVRSGRDALLLAFDAPSYEGIYRGEWWEDWSSGDETYWSLLFTDRSQYRTTDRVAIWGYLRARDRDSVPASVDVRIVPYDSDAVSAPAIAEGRAEPDAVGVFSLPLEIDRAPHGNYRIVAVVDGRVVAERFLEVTVIRKPEYQLTLVPDQLAVLVGTPVRLAAAATFFDGTPAGGIPLRLTTFDDEDRNLPPTDFAGTAGIDWVATVPDERMVDGDPSHAWLGVMPSGPESGEIQADARVLVFTASEHLAATGSVASGRLRATGTLRAVDLGAVGRQLVAAEWDGDPGGPGIGARTISVSVTELVPVRTKVGTRYDFIEKVVVPIYRYDIERKLIRNTEITSQADGRLVLDVPIPSNDHQYEVRMWTRDAANRQVNRTITVGSEFQAWWWSDEVRFARPDGNPVGDRGYRVGEDIVWDMTSDGERLPAAEPNRYLYIVAQRGLVRVSSTETPTFRRTFRASDAPGIFVMGVRFTGTTYAPKAASWADIEIDQRRLDVTVTADRSRYRPGDVIGLTVRARDEAGRPVAADVVLQAVDEKLYAMGAAMTPDPAYELYRRVDSGIVRLTSTHQVPTTAGGEGEGGDAGGGGARSDFRDMLAFVRLRTNADGVATTTVRASDDLTAWRVSASALTADLRAGVGELSVEVGLPIFASVTAAAEYLVTDRPFVRLRAFGRDLRPGDPVVFTVSSSTLGLAATTLEGTAFTGTWLALPALRLGRHSLDVAVLAPTHRDQAGTPVSDRLIVTFDVVDSRLTLDRTGYGQVGGQVPSPPGSLPATYTFTDAGRGRYLPTLLDLTASTSVRLDRGLAGAMARALLVDAFARDPGTLPPDSFDPERYEIAGPLGPGDDGEYQGTELGIALLPYGGVDPWLAADVAIAAPGSGPAARLRWVLMTIRDDTTLPRDLRVAAVAGLASLGEPVLADVQTLRAEATLTARESILLGLAAAALGDEATARSIERAVLEASGQRLGPWVRIQAGSSPGEIAEVTALAALLAARIGDPLAPALLEFALDHPSAETSHALMAAATIAALLDRTPAAATTFAYTVDGRRTVVDIPPAGSVTIAVSGAQRATLRLEPISGAVGVALEWRAPADLESLAVDPTIGLTRVRLDRTPADRLVVVTLQATFTSAALESGCYTVVEQVPSGLVPLAEPVGQPESESIAWPSSIEGQRVSFCFAHGRRSNPTTATLRYVARVVSTGTFAWEPAFMGLDGVPEVVAITSGATIRIEE